MSKDYHQLIVDKMLSKDAYSAHLGMCLVTVNLGSALVEMYITPLMCNGFGVAHGSIAYALADSAAAFAANTHDGIAVTIDNTMSYMSPIRAGDILTAEAVEVYRSRSIAHYQVRVSVGDQLVATMKSTLKIRPGTAS